MDLSDRQQSKISSSADNNIKRADTNITANPRHHTVYIDKETGSFKYSFSEEHLDAVDSWTTAASAAPATAAQNQVRSPFFRISMRGVVLGAIGAILLVLVAGTDSANDHARTSSLSPSLASASILQSDASLTRTKYIIAKNLNCRAQPAASARIVANLAYGMRVDVIDSGPAWSKISHTSGQCWSASRYLSNVAPTAGPRQTDWDLIGLAVSLVAGGE